MPQVVQGPALEEAQDALAGWMAVTVPVSPLARPLAPCRLRCREATVSVKRRRTCPNNFPSNARGNLRGKGKIRMNCRMGTTGKTRSTRFAAPSEVRLPKQLEHTVFSGCRLM